MPDLEPNKEVYFHEYCKTCNYKDVKNTDDPCHECLSEPTNLHSHKPVKYEESKKKGGGK